MSGHNAHKRTPPVYNGDKVLVNDPSHQFLYSRCDIDSWISVLLHDLLYPYFAGIFRLDIPFIIYIIEKIPQKIRNTDCPQINIIPGSYRHSRICAVAHNLQSLAESVIIVQRLHLLSGREKICNIQNQPSQSLSFKNALED